MRKRESFSKGRKTLTVFGFQCEKLLNRCMEENIPLRDVSLKDDLTMKVTLRSIDFKKFSRLAKNKYQIKEESEKGWLINFNKIFFNKAYIIGAIVFVFLLFYQNSFVAEIRIDGYEKLHETDIRNALSSYGFYEGCKKDIDLDNVKGQMYASFNRIAWMNITYKGSLAEVEIVEEDMSPKKIDQKAPCNIVAAKDGFVERVVARDGIRLTDKAQQVQKGDVLISGIIPVNDTTYGTNPLAGTDTYIHADGEIWAKVIYRYISYQDKYEWVMAPTGKNLFGIKFIFGDVKFNSLDIFDGYESSKYSGTGLFHFTKPIPVSLDITRNQEVEVTKRTRTEEEITLEASRTLRKQMEENNLENTQILNKSLKFHEEKNIIVVSYMVETLEQIGIEEEIIFGEPTN